MLLAADMKAGEKRQELNSSMSMVREWRHSDFSHPADVQEDLRLFWVWVARYFFVSLCVYE